LYGISAAGLPSIPAPADSRNPDLCTKASTNSFSEADIQWRTEAEGVPPSALFIASPYDPEAHLAKKRSTSWVGYKVHLTESCEDDQPHLITHVETTAAPGG
jgi:hypothetical protein